MLIKTAKPSQVKENEITPETIYTERRNLLQGMGLAGLSLAGMGLSTSSQNTQAQSAAVAVGKNLDFKNLQNPKPDFDMTPVDKATTHNNFYEFGTRKFEPAMNAKDFKVDPWTLEISGEVDKPVTIDVWELINSTALEERIYRFRCVEAWSMNIPWIGIELAQLIKQAQPNSRAKFVAFETLYDPEQMPGQKSRRIGGGIDYPYVEGLRIDEAMHPLSMMVIGMYGKTLPPQNGAPLRLMSPWKYGFKAIKSIVKIKLVEKMPPTTWNILAANEYGFYANVNPEVDHPRWSQASERFVGEGRLAKRKATLPFNGYAEEVASLYSGMDLTRWF
ncbi:protein-methionine-sulfoxide reductase catalytic subunit MsrP [Aurantivibrio infirmus]